MALQGDSFTLAFHSVADALAFATAAQVELLLAAWPAELLKLEVSVHMCLSVTCILGEGFCFCSPNRLLRAAWLAELLELVVTVHTSLSVTCILGEGICFCSPNQNIASTMAS